MKTINIPVQGAYGKDRMQIINRYKQDIVPSEYVSVVKLSQPHMTVTEKSVLCAVQIISDHFKKKGD